jgi:ElaB/YqjD/DUF883 family membrane-anchored ribosome-binding protein
MAATKTARKPATATDARSPVDYLQDALDELTKARERAGDDIRSGIDAAIERTRDAMKEAGSGAQEQITDWRASLESASDEVRRELGVLAVRAQRSPEALRAMSAEIRKRKTEISPSK